MNHWELNYFRDFLDFFGFFDLRFFLLVFRDLRPPFDSGSTKLATP